MRDFLEVEFSSVASFDVRLSFFDLDTVCKKDGEVWVCYQMKGVVGVLIEH